MVTVGYGLHGHVQLSIGEGMVKLNNKGFTVIELVYLMMALAIVSMGVTFIYLFGRVLYKIGS